MSLVLAAVPTGLTAELGAACLDACEQHSQRDSGLLLPEDALAA
jgi:hypothetical protein